MASSQHSGQCSDKNSVAHRRALRGGAQLKPEVQEALILNDAMLWTNLLVQFTQTLPVPCVQGAAFMASAMSAKLGPRNLTQPSRPVYCKSLIASCTLPVSTPCEELIYSAAHRLGKAPSPGTESFRPGR